MRPIIAMVVSYIPDRRTLMVRENYIELVRDAGGDPFLLPMGTHGETLERMLDRCDGLLLTGGDDVEPARYGEETLPCCGDIAYARDGFEIELIRAAIKRSMPIFGICRGIQILNVALGGSLYQDLAGQLVPEAKAHQQPEPYGQPSHVVKVAPGTPLRELWQVDEMPVNSMHHQGIRRIAEGLAPMAWSPDGLIEAVYMPGERFVRAVQWHPEYMCEHDMAEGIRAPQMDMLRQFVTASEEYARR